MTPSLRSSLPQGGLSPGKQHSRQCEVPLYIYDYATGQVESLSARP